MLKTYVTLTILFSIYLVTAIKIEVELDEGKDIILYNGKIYHPSYIRIKNENQEKLTNEHKEPIHSLHEEELVDGAQFWIYIGIIICKN
jgi:hypothetical protein